MSQISLNATLKQKQKSVGTPAENGVYVQRVIEACDDLARQLLEENLHHAQDEACTKLHEAMQGTVQMAHLEMRLINASDTDLELPPTTLEGARE